LIPEADKKEWVTARQGSRQEDNKGNDIVNPLNIRFQCKKRISDHNRLDVTPLFELSKEDYLMDVLFIKATRKNTTRESLLGEYVVVDANTYSMLFLESTPPVNFYRTKAAKANIPFDYEKKEKVAYVVQTKLYQKAIVIIPINVFLNYFDYYLKHYVYTK